MTFFNKLTRRQFITLSTLGFLGAMTSKSSATIVLPPNLDHGSMRRFGTTFSQLQCWYLGLDYRETFHQIAQLGFDRIRICGYWHELEPQRDRFDFTALDWLLEECDRYNIDVILTVGMKAPRYPEFHFPNWVKDRYNTTQASRPLDSDAGLAYHTLYFIDRLVRHARTAPAVKYWQVENEPFTTLEITKGRSLSPRFIQREVELVRSLALPHQKLLLTNAITLPDAQLADDDRAFEASLKLADAVGFNIYTKVPQGASANYIEAQPAYWEKLATWQTTLHQQNKESWIAEAQAEPWEPNELVPVKQIDYPSSSPSQVANLVDTVQTIGFNPILLWGCEYWYWNLKQGRNQWWLSIQNLIDANI